LGDGATYAEGQEMPDVVQEAQGVQKGQQIQQALVGGITQPGVHDDAIIFATI
jgi:hypothetical protein